MEVSLRSFFLVGLINLVSLCSFAQTNGNSPYSIFGVGEYRNSGVGRNNAMGGLGYATSNPLFINLVNPALLARTNNTVFDMGLLSQTRFLTTNTQTQRNTNINLEYLTLAFPITTRWTSSIGLQPYSVVDYDVSFTEVVNDTTSALYDYSGIGGINKVFWSNGVKLGDISYIGLEAAYLFGNIEKEQTSQLSYPTTGPAGTKNVFFQRRSYSDFYFKPGFAIRKEIMVVRDSVAKKRVSCISKEYETWKSRIDHCIDTLPNTVLNLEEPRPVSINLDTLSKEEGKAIRKANAKRNKELVKINHEKRKSYCEETLEKIDRRTSYRDTVLWAYSVYTKEKLQKVIDRAIVGEHMILVPGDEDVTLVHFPGSQTIKKQLDDLFEGKLPPGYGVVILPGSERRSGKELLKEMRSLAAKGQQMKEGLQMSKETVANYCKQHARRGSGIFLNLGTSYEFSSSVNTRNLQTVERRRDDNEILTSDTLSFDDNATTTLPNAIHFGIGIEKPEPSGTTLCGRPKKSVWSIGLDYSQFFWNKYAYNGATTSFDNSFNIVLGGEIIPNLAASVKSIWPRVIYRAGVALEKTPYMINGETIMDFGINFGLSFPVSSDRYPRYLNVGFSGGQRGTTDSGLIKENYIKTSVSVTLNYKWFQRNRYGL